MPNKFFNNMHGPNFTGKNGAPTGQEGKQHDAPMKTPNWPGLPGKAQSKDRSNEVKKCHCYPTSKGI